MQGRPVISLHHSKKKKLRAYDVNCHDYIPTNRQSRTFVTKRTLKRNEKKMENGKERETAAGKRIFTDGTLKGL